MRSINSERWFEGKVLPHTLAAMAHTAAQIASRLCEETAHSENVSRSLCYSYN